MASSTLDQPIVALHRIAKRLARPLKRLGIVTVDDLLHTYPVRHEDLRVVTSIRDLRIGARAVVHGRVIQIANRRSPRRRLALTEALIEDGTGSIRCVWFHQPYLAHVLPVGLPVAVAGTVASGVYGMQFAAPLIESLRGAALHTGRIVPMYQLTAGITQKQLRFLVNLALGAVAALREVLPQDVRLRERLIGIAEATREVHFPTNDAALARARERLAFEELYVYLADLRATRAELASSTAPHIPFDEAATRAFVAQLPFHLTDDQRRAAWEILQDMGDRSRASVAVMPMQRLLNGDVGSGKTVVAAIACTNVARAGAQVAYLAPTEVLAIQQARSLTRLLIPLGVHVGLWTRTVQEIDGEPVTAQVIAAAVRGGEVGVVIGTHAILSPRVRFHRLALAIIDEQHRFGVAQRAALRAKADGMTPHLLSMTATPIPRTLSLALLGDLEQSILAERPPGRLSVRTVVVPPAERLVMAQEVRRELAQDHQVFVICSQIDESEDGEVAAVSEAVERARRAFPDSTVGVLHGRLKPAEQRMVMASFTDRRIAVLVATTVVEVGVDQPNATVMVIEDAERFGLAQLHQLRGRVGRGDAPGTCYLTTRSEDPAVRVRLDRVAACTDGFALADLDLAERGPGILAGILQSGWPTFRFASLDPAFVRRVQAALTATPAVPVGAAVHLE